MEKGPSYTGLALAGVERLRETDFDLRGRAAALPLLLRGAYYTGEGKWRALAEEDLRALWRGGVHDHVGGGFFSAALDREWLRPRFEKRLDDNAILAWLFAEAWEKGRMGFYRAAAEEALDWILRELSDPSGLYRAGQYADGSVDDPYLFTPAQIREILGEEKGRGFEECYDVTDEGNCGEGRSIPNLLLNGRWNLVPEGFDDLRERLRLAREARGGVSADPRLDSAANALLLAALAKAGRVFSDRRYLAAAAELAEVLKPTDALPRLARAALLFALTELYAADFDPAHIAAASSLAGTLDRAEESGDTRPSPARDRTLSLAALGLAALWRLTGEEALRAEWVDILLRLGRHPERHGPESLPALCVQFDLERPPRTLLCVCPEEKIPDGLVALRSRYAPDLTLLLKTPARAAALAAAAPRTAAAPIGAETLFYPVEKAEIGPPHRL